MSSSVHLETRLAAVERHRLRDVRRTEHAWPGSASIGLIRPPDQSFLVRDQAGGAISRTSRSPWNGPTPLTLAEVGDQAETEATAAPEALSLQEDESDRIAASEPPLDSLWDTIKRDVRHMPGDLWSGTKRVYANPVHLAILGVGYGASLSLQETGPDDTVEDHFRHRHHHFKEDWRDAFGAAGNPGTHFALAGLWYLVGQQAGDTKTYEVGRTMFSALIINGLTVMVGQAASSDRSPNGEWGTFPSGHTSSSFVMASVLHHAYGHAVGVPLYGLATLCAMERVEDGEHYLSDVVMGAVLGTVIGHAVASGRDPEFFGWKILPYASMDTGRTGIAFAKSF